MFFVSSVVAFALGVTTFFVHEQGSTFRTRLALWLGFANIGCVMGINLMYALATWWR